MRLLPPTGRQRSLDRSSLDPADKLAWALDAVLEDQFEVCEAFAEYLHRHHPQTAWQTLADRVLGRLDRLKGAKGFDDFSRNYERDRLSNWAIHALERAGRETEVIPLCMAEAQRTGSYDRLVQRLIAAQRYVDAEEWIRAGLRASGNKWPGLTAGLRDKFREIRTLEQNWPVLAALQVEEFVRQPARQAFTECQEACDKTEVGQGFKSPHLHHELGRVQEVGNPGVAGLFYVQELQQKHAYIDCQKFFPFISLSPCGRGLG
jgi:uncharacterized Zn finger protein